MNQDPIEKFRTEFFEKVRKDKEAELWELKQKQRACLHKYDQGVIALDGFQTLTCKKCAHKWVRKVWSPAGSRQGGSAGSKAACSVQ